MDGYLVIVPPEITPLMPSDLKAVNELVDRAFAGGEGSLDLGEAWGGIHYLLTGGELPIPKEIARQRGILWFDASEENILFGGEETPLQASYGAVRYHPPEAVAHWAGVLARTPTEKLAASYDADALTEDLIPPGEWESAERKAWLIEQYKRLVHFYHEAAQQEAGLLLFVW